MKVDGQDGILLKLICLPLIMRGPVFVFVNYGLIIILNILLLFGILWYQWSTGFVLIYFFLEELIIFIVLILKEIFCKNFLNVWRKILQSFAFIMVHLLFLLMTLGFLADVDPVAGKALVYLIEFFFIPFEMSDLAVGFTFYILFLLIFFETVLNLYQNKLNFDLLYSRMVKFHLLFFLSLGFVVMFKRYSWLPFMLIIAKALLELGSLRMQTKEPPALRLKGTLDS